MMKKLALTFFLCLLIKSSDGAPIDFQKQLNRPAKSIRIATFNASMSRKNAGQLQKDLESDNHPNLKKVARIIQVVNPDILLLNEFDYDASGKSIRQFQKNYLSKPQSGSKPIEYAHTFSHTVNTGEPSSFDLNNDGKTGGPADAYGFGQFPGQYGMVLLSKYPIQEKKVRTFQKFLWKEMPGALRPKIDQFFYSDDEWQSFRLSSKSHWDVPVSIGNRTLHLLAFHPTPPVFDGKEDRNGCRNHDEIRFWADYIDPSKSTYHRDDQGKTGGLTSDDSFVILGDANADANDGDSRQKAIVQLLNHPRVFDPKPTSPGGSQQAKLQGGKNLSHKGDPAMDTSDFGDRGRASGNLRIDYALPSKDLAVLNSGVFWPDASDPNFELTSASDHRLVWIDVSSK